MVASTNRVLFTCGQIGSAVRMADSIGARLAEHRPTPIEIIAVLRAWPSVNERGHEFIRFSIPFCSAIGIDSGLQRDIFRQRRRLSAFALDKADDLKFRQETRKISVPKSFQSHVLIRANLIVDFNDAELKIGDIIAAEGIPLDGVEFYEPALEHPGGVFTAAGAYCDKYKSEAPTLKRCLANKQFIQDPKALFHLFRRRSRPLVRPSNGPIKVGDELYSARELGVPARCLQLV